MLPVVPPSAFLTLTTPSMLVLFVVVISLDAVKLCGNAAASKSSCMARCAFTPLTANFSTGFPFVS